MRNFTSLLAAAMLSACAYTTTQSTPQLDQRFGLDTRMTLAQQILYQDGGRANARENGRVDGMDGRSARAAYERYQKAAGEAQPSLLSGGAK